MNTAVEQDPDNYAHGIGFSAPNALYNVGADWTLTPHIVSTTRYGYYFNNYHDFGWPTSSPDIVWDTPGTTTDVFGNPLPPNLQLAAGTSTTAFKQSYTLFNSSKHYQFNQDFAIYKGGWWGSHNFKFGYQLNHLSNIIDQNGNVPQVSYYLGPKQSHNPLTTTGADNCTKLDAVYGGYCEGQYGYAVITDFATILTSPASDYNHALYVQDSWTIGKGVTLDVGLRIEKESLPAPAGVKVSAINFPWSDKIEPRLGGAWDPTGHGKMKFFGSYDVVNDVMKLLVAQTSFGAQAFEQCTYPLGPDGIAGQGYANSDIDLVFKGGRACPDGVPTTGANFNNSDNTPPTSFVDTATGVSLIENANERPWEPVAPASNPIASMSMWLDGTIRSPRNGRSRRATIAAVWTTSSRTLRWTTLIEGELYTIVNPGEGVNSTLDGYATFLGSLGQAFGEPGIALRISSLGIRHLPELPGQCPRPSVTTMAWSSG